MYLNFGRLKMHISPFFAVFLALSANILEGRIYLLSFLSVFIHEMTHILFLFANGCDSANMNFYPGGIKLSSDGFSRLPYKKTVACTLSAPAVNIIFGFILYFSNLFADISVLSQWSAINFIMGFVNLLPLPFLDGGRALRAVLCEYSSDLQKTEKICDVCTLICLAGMFAALFFLAVFGFFHVVMLFFFVYCTLGFISDKRLA